MPAFTSLPRSARWPRLLGLLSLLAAAGCAAYLLFGGIYSSISEDASDTEGGVVVTTAQGWQDYAIVGWASFIVLLGVVTALAAWWGRSGPVWVGTCLLFMLAVLGVASIGLFVAPVALLVFFTAYGLSVSRRRRRAAS